MHKGKNVQAIIVIVIGLKEYTLSKSSAGSLKGCHGKERELLIRKSAPIHVIVHYPTTEEGKAELARRVAAVHAESVIAKINRLSCPTKQKLELVDAVIDTVKRRKREPESTRGHKIQAVQEKTVYEKI